MSLSNLTAWEQNLRTMTVLAGRAAELGRWDQVEECYRLRGEQLRDYSVAPPLAKYLALLDREVESRIVNARLAMRSQLIETAKIRQKVLELRSWQGSEVEPPCMTKMA
jgi:hypothetical protein